MDLRHVSDGFHLDRKDSLGREALFSSWFAAGSLPHSAIDTGGNDAGNGGNGYFAGSLIDSSYATFEPVNMAQAGAHAIASAHQTNIGIFDQAATQIAGIGGDGGDSNAAVGGSVGGFGSFGSDVIATGDNSAGNGGDGHFSGTLVHAPVAIFDPVNIAVAGFHGAADAHQSNTAEFHQGASQFAGNGGNGGNGNAAIGGDTSVFGGAGAAPHSIGGAGPARALAQVLIMGSAAWLVLEQGRSPAIIFATTLLFGRALAPIEGAIAGWKAFAMASAAYRRLNGVMAAVTPVADIKALPDRPKGCLIVDNVGAVLPGSNHLMLRGVSFGLAPGECLGIIGPSGSGKSKLGKIIAGISAPTVGSVRLDGVDVLSVRDSGGGRRLGYLPQDIDLFGETVRDIIARLDGADLQQVIDAAKLTGLHEMIIRLPRAYDTVVVGGGSNLSRGFRQHLGLARAFFGDPHLVVLDEPNASLDYLGERVLFEAIERMKAANTTVIIITHRIGILAATNKIAIMQGGAVSAFGDSKEIFERYLARPQVSSRESAQPHSIQECERGVGASPQPVLP